MGRKKSLFSGGSRSVSVQITNSNHQPHPPDIDNSKEALEKRAAARRILPTVELLGSIQLVAQKRNPTYNYDLTNLSNTYPHHDPLIRQLLVGILYTRGRSSTYVGSLYSCIPDFIEFLNDQRNLSNTPVSLVSDITVTVCRAYITYLVSRFPRRALNQDRYSSLRQIIKSLQKTFPNEPGIGAVIDWPVGPARCDKPRQGYTQQAIAELIVACQRDMTETMDLHAISNNAKRGEVLRRAEWNLPNLMFYLSEKLAKPQERTIGTFLGIIVNTSPNARSLLAREGFTIKEMAALYIAQGEELARNGHYPSKKEIDWTLENFMFWVKYRWEHSPQRYCPIVESIKRYVRGTPSIKEFLNTVQYSPDGVVKLYLEHGKELASKGRSLFGHHFNRDACREDAERNLRIILATLAQKYPNYPFNMSFAEATDFFTQNRYEQLSDDEQSSLEKRLISAVYSTPSYFYDGTITRINLIRAAMHFLLDTLYPFLLHVQINSGWNLESVLAISDDVDAHVTADLIDPENYVVIQSTKNRGQRGGAKLVFHRCSRHRRFSTYRLLKYVESIVTQYKGCQHYQSEQLWQFAVRPSSTMRQLISYYGRDGDNIYYASRLFIKRHFFKYFNESSIDHGRIRTSYETLREQQGLPLAVISHDMDHADVETTSRHYASDSTSNAIKDVKIAQYQEQLIEDLRHYECKIVESLSLAKLRDAITQSHDEATRTEQLTQAAVELGTDEKTVRHLISPGGQTYIAACRDSLDPTWLGHEEYLKSGQACSFFNKCPGCKQAVIFPEALPYIVQRTSDLEQLRKEVNPFEWLSNYGEEWDAWQAILLDWNNKEEVEAARQAAISGKALLPIRMRGAR